jgi:hypothetical protein
MIGLCRQQAYSGPGEEHLPQTPWWMNILYVYTAAVAVAAAILNGSLDSHLDSSSLMQSMQDAIDLLRSYAQTRPSAKRCLATLTSILQLRSAGVAAPESRVNGDHPYQHYIDGVDPNTADVQNDFMGTDMSWTLPVGAENAALEFFSDQWLLQPQLDSFSYLGI